MQSLNITHTLLVSLICALTKFLLIRVDLPTRSANIIFLLVDNWPCPQVIESGWQSFILMLTKDLSALLAVKRIVSLLQVVSQNVGVDPPPQAPNEKARTRATAEI